jgi:hypothetical protein
MKNHFAVLASLVVAAAGVGCGSSSPPGGGPDGSGGAGGSGGSAADSSIGSAGHGDAGSTGPTPDGGAVTDATTATDTLQSNDVATQGVDASGSPEAAAEAGSVVDGGHDAGSVADAAREASGTLDAARDATGAGDACTKTTPLAFPGAVGFGAAATGARGSAAYHVTNLNDTGTGSFRDAVGTSHRTIVFDVGGIINLASAVSVSSDLTIAGQTAPGGGIAVEGREVSFSNSSNIIVRYVRFRQGTNDPDTGKSVIAADATTSLILDHVSIEFGQWDNLDVNSGMNATIQRSIIADPIGQQFNAHCTSGNLTWFEDIFSSAHNRSPLAKGDTQFINNVVYNFQAGYTAGNSSGVFTHDIVNNYFIAGPSTTNTGDAFFQMNDQSVYQAGNELDTKKGGTISGTAMGLPGGSTALAAPWVPSTASLASADAAAAYAYDIANSGALPRDDVDALVIADVTSLGTTGRLWTSQSQTGLTNGGYGTLAGGTAPVDTDGDGIPDAWETAHGLNPNDASDALTVSSCTGYTNLEDYLNSLADSLM